MEHLLEKIQQRRSRFPVEYTGGSIPRKDLELILEAARWAPNHRKTEPWKYKVIQGSALSQLGQFMQSQYALHNEGKSSMKVRKLAQKMEQSAAILLIFMSRDPKESVPEWEEIAAVAMSVQNIWLMTQELGYGGYWSSPKDFADLAQFDAIEVASQDRFLGFFYMGAVESTTVDLPERKKLTDFVEFVS